MGFHISFVCIQKYPSAASCQQYDNSFVSFFFPFFSFFIDNAMILGLSDDYRQ